MCQKLISTLGSRQLCLKEFFWFALLDWRWARHSVPKRKCKFMAPGIATDCRSKERRQPISSSQCKYIGGSCPNNPNTEGLGLELAGVELTERGYIKVNERLQTTAPGVWAIGEVA